MSGVADDSPFAVDMPCEPKNKQQKPQGSVKQRKMKIRDLFMENLSSTTHHYLGPRRFSDVVVHALTFKWQQRNVKFQKQNIFVEIHFIQSISLFLFVIAPQGNWFLSAYTWDWVLNDVKCSQSLSEITFCLSFVFAFDCFAQLQRNLLRSFLNRILMDFDEICDWWRVERHFSDKLKRRITWQLQRQAKAPCHATFQRQAEAPCHARFQRQS